MTSATVVIPVLNGAETIGDTLRALLSQAGAPADLEIIVVDNGSTDGTPELVGEFPVTLLRCATPGASAARNVGLNVARGELFVCLDADTLPTRTWLRELLRPFADPKVMLVGGRILSFRPETGSERYIEQSGLFRPENHVHNPDFPFVVTCNLAVRREAALAIDGWDQALLRAEDIDFSTRLLARFPQPLHYAPQALLFHRNRRSDDALVAQARGYGYGLALIYRRYPDRVRWGLQVQMLILGRLIRCAIQPELLRVGHRLGRVSAEELEFARYQRLWTRAFWGGFFATWYEA